MQAFSNIRVVDLTHVIAGPFCTYQLAVMGADVIKVESPENPDMSRTSGAADDDGMHSDFAAQNANKRAVAINLKCDDGVAVLKKLIQSADVFVENYRSGAMAKLKLDYAAVKKITPDIIYCSITGFGGDGSLAGRTAYDNVIQAYSGLMAATGDTDSSPMKVGPPVLDYGTGMQAAFAIASALYQRGVSGDGQHIDVSMLDAAIVLMSSNVTRLHTAGEHAPLTGNDSAFNAGYCCYQTQNGRLMLGAYTGAQTKNMWTALGDAAHGEALSTLTPMAMERHFTADKKRIAAILKTKTADEWEAAFNRRRVPAARVRELDEALDDPQVKGRSVLQPVSGAPHPLPVAGFAFADDGPKLRSPPPTIAAHTREVLTEAGYDDDELAALHRRGAIKINDKLNDEPGDEPGGE